MPPVARAPPTAAAAAARRIRPTGTGAPARAFRRESSLSGPEAAEGALPLGEDLLDESRCHPRVCPRRDDTHVGTHCREVMRHQPGWRREVRRHSSGQPARLCCDRLSGRLGRGLRRRSLVGEREAVGLLVEEARW